MRKLSKKISMLMVLAMLVSLFSGIVSASAASVWSFKSSKYDVEVGETIEMEKNEYADFDLFKSDAAPAGYTVKWKSSDPDAVWVNAKTGQLRADKFKNADYGDKATISATFTNTATKKSATRSFVIVVAEKAAYTLTTKIGDVVLGAEALAVDTEYALASTVTANGKAVEATVAYTVDGAVVKSLKFAAAGEYTVVATATVDGKVVATAKTAVVVAAKEFSAVATGIKEITVYGNFAKDAKFVVKKNTTQNVAFTTTVAADGKSAELTLNNKLTKGVYTVSYGDAKVDLAIEDEKVETIIILEKGGQIFTDSTKTKAYVHYDVLNQYGESVRKTFDVDWSHNADSDSEDRTNGILTLTKVDGYDYNDMIVLTGVAHGYGFAESETATMSIGLERNASSVKVLGIVKDESTELLNEIPAGFTGGEYFLVFEMYDRAGYVIDFDADVADEDLKFISLNPLLAEIDDDAAIKTVYIDGVSYGALALAPGRTEQVKKGGVAEISITSTKTGVNSPYLLRVVSEQILDDFRIIAPSDIIAKNNPWNGATEVALGYEAIDINGAAITDFRALYKAVSFSDSNVVLEENNDGTARLYYTVASNVRPTEEYDYPVVFTAIVQGSGKSSNMTLNVKAARSASAVAGLVSQGGCEYILEGNAITLDLIDNTNNGRPMRIEFADQYDSIVKSAGLFATGDGKYLAAKLVEKNSLDIIISGTPAAASNADYQLFDPSQPITLLANTDVTPNQKAVIIEFAIADEDGKILSGSDKRFTFYVVDINNCVDFTAAPKWPESDALINLVDSEISYAVTATLTNGKTIAVQDEVPGNYAIKYTAGKQYYDPNPVAGVTGAAITVNKATTGLVQADFLDHSGVNPDGSAKYRNLVYSVVTQIFVGEEYTLKAEMENLFEIGYNEYPYAVRINTKNWNMWPHSWAKENTEGIVRPLEGKITVDDLMVFINNATDNFGKDRYGTIKVSVSKLTDGGKGIYAGGPTLGTTALIENAEIGDTFVATYADGGCKHVITMTVGADQTAKFSDSKEDCDWR